MSEVIKTRFNLSTFALLNNDDCSPPTLPLGKISNLSFTTSLQHLLKKPNKTSPAHRLKPINSSKSLFMDSFGSKYNSTMHH